jgi:hypothetical protein
MLLYARMRSLLPLALVAASAVPAGATGIGLSGPSVWNGDASSAVAGAQAVEATGTAWARVNVRLDVWNAPGDPTLRGPQQLTWFQAYDRVIDELTTHGVQVYILINAEAVPGGGEPDSDDFVDRYTAAAVKIIDHFKDRVRVYEIFNEPNNWRDAVSQRPAISPYYLAKLLRQIYLGAKHDGGRNQNPCDQVTLVSGALFSFDGTDAADYLMQVYQQGRSKLAWDWMHANVGTYPLDAIGYHVYVGQGSDATPASIKAATAQNLAGIEAAVDAQDAGSNKHIWLTEFGWTTDQVSAQQQADFLTASYQQLDTDPRVDAAFWFTFQDFPGGNYGLYASSGLSPGDRHPLVYDAFTRAVKAFRPARNAMFVSNDLPLSLAPGETRTLHIQLKNLGTLAWSAAGSQRLAAGPGCPSSVAANQLDLSPGPAGGYVKSATDARLFLDAAATIQTDDTADFTFDVTAPLSPGDYTFALRMVHEGVAWFGDTYRAGITVVPDPAGTPGDGQPGTTGPGGAAGGGGAGSTGGGCTMASDGHPGELLFALAGIFVCALTLRRRT